MKQITAIIKPFKLDEVTDALQDHEINGMTVTEVKGFGRQKGHVEAYRGSEYTVDFLPKIKIELVVADKHAGPIQDTIARVARIGKIGDGVMWVTNVEEFTRIRTGEKNEQVVT